MPREPQPDPLLSAEEFVTEAEKTHGDWRAALLKAARMKLDDARAALRDGEEALSTQPARAAALMRRGLDERRREIERVAKRIRDAEATSSGEE